MSDCSGFWKVFIKGALVVGAVMLLSAPSGAQSRAGGSQDPITSILDKYAHEEVTKSPASADAGQVDSGYREYKVIQERNRFFAVLLLVLTALAAQFLLLWRLGNSSPNQVVNGTGLIYIVIGTIVLVSLSDNKDQLAASTGILGAIAGYLFGSMRPGEHRAEGKSERAETRPETRPTDGDPRTQRTLDAPARP